MCAAYKLFLLLRRSIAKGPGWTLLLRKVSPRKSLNQYVQDQSNTPKVERCHGSRVVLRKVSK